jgi:hypothetical protein
MTREAPGAGRAKLRLSRGFPRGLAHPVTPLMDLVDQSTDQFVGSHGARQDDPGSPGLSEASPYPELRPTYAAAPRATSPATFS